MNNIWNAVVQSAKEAKEAFVFFLYFIGSALLVLLPFFGIVVLADYVSNWCILLMIPYFILLPLLSKPLGKCYEPTN